MLARVLWGMWGILAACTVVSAEVIKPNVLLIRIDEPPTPVIGEAGGSIPEVFDFDQVLNANWKSERGTCLASPGRSAVQAALLFGTPPLQHGVVADLDWRRKAVAAQTLADQLQKAGYHTAFYGTWGLGSAKPFDPQSRGFSQAQYFETAASDTLTDIWGLSKNGMKWVFDNPHPEKPYFAYISQGHHLTREVITAQLEEWISRNAGISNRPTVVVILETGKSSEKSPRGIAPDQYYYPAKWYCFVQGTSEINGEIKTDWDLYHLIQKVLGEPKSKKQSVMVFHKACWSVSDSPEKHRHRGSLVIDRDLALIDGLRLFPAKDLAPDLTAEMDISEHSKQHQHLLTVHAKWWQGAQAALNDQRAFEVGKTDAEKLSLTALDWRTSKIIHPDGSSPLSVPMVYQENLIEVLDALKTNAEYRETFPAYSGSWAVNITRSGRYKITASLLPEGVEGEKHKNLKKLEGGQAHIKLGRNEVQLRLHKGATSVSVQTDADPGVTDLECWFTGQLPLTRELGAFFVTIERVGDKKFDLKAKAADSP
ncbi:hypothetical protein NT6N_31180 [Oceaniferula spumae]|uniref:Sulfatase N-terminal domain-containing protein n=1 Tax=Oceaniferula spumae TaxID=2979115 RepID=A0AAT9FQ17_9BACT